MDINEGAPDIQVFLKFYPEFILKVEHNEKDDLIKFFNITNKIKRKMISMIYDEEQIKKLMEQQKKTDIYSLNFDNKEVISIQKINSQDEKTKEDKILYKIMQKEEDVEKYIDKTKEDIFLINKGIEEQKRNIKRTQDVKKALGLFFEKSELIQKILKNYGINKSQNSGNKAIRESNRNKVRNLVSNLSENVIIEKYEKGKFVIIKDDIGTDCYFLISGRLSILKPVEYKNIKISYENYFKYLLNLLEKNEKKIFDTVVNVNYHFIKVYNEENFMEIIKYYVQKRISFYSNITGDLSEKKTEEDLTLDKIESFINEYKLKFEDFELSKENILSDIQKLKNDEKSDDPKLTINNYFKDIFKVDKHKEYLLKPYDFIFQKQEEDKDKLVTLYKYENFLTLSPGAFFGEMSADSENKKRNASIRAETDCILASLSLVIYANLLMDENKKIILRQINFICNNFFFNNIPEKLFAKKYFSMFKLINFSKDNIIYEQGNNCDSVFFINDGTIKYEMCASVTEIHNMIYFLISGLKSHKVFKINNKIMDELKLAYIKNHNLIKIKNDNPILMKKMNEIQKFELSISESFEVLGLPEYFFEIPYITTCSVISSNVRLFELSGYNLNQIISSQIVIKKDLFKLLCKKIIVFIRRLFNIENNSLKNINVKIDSSSFNDTKSTVQGNSFENKSLLDEKNINSKDFKEEGKKDINENDDSIIKKMSKSGNTNNNIKNLFYSPLKLNKEILNKKLISEINKLSNLHSYLNLKRKYDENIPNSERNIIQKEKKSNIINNLTKGKEIKHKQLVIHEYKEKIENQVDTEENENFFIKSKFNNEKINDSLSNSNWVNQMINLNNSKKLKESEKQTIINTGKEYIFLPKLKKLLFSIHKLKENNLSIVKNDLKTKLDKKENTLIIENESFINEQNNMLDKNSLPAIPRQYSFRSLPIKRKFKRKINRSVEYLENISKINRDNDNNKKSILVKYIKNYYNKQKTKGISAFLNPRFNSIIKMKENKSLENILNKIKIN